MATAREQSRKEYLANNGHESLRLGCLHRIADAMELTAKNYVAMQGDLDRYKRWYETEQACRKQLERRMSSMRGVITRLKRKSTLGIDSQLIESLNFICGHIDECLPEGYEIRVSLRRNASSVELFDRDGEVIELDPPFGVSCLNVAIEAAKSRESGGSDVG